MSPPAGARGVRLHHRRRLGPLLAALAAWVGMSQPVQAQARGEAPQVRVAQGTLAGTRLEDGTIRFAGIPYAAPPVGPLRWRPPRPAPRWSGVRDAGQFGSTCPQPDMGWNAWDAARASEDCLSVNVWIPAGSGTRRPVMVWFHGGAFLGGSGSAPTYDGATLSRHGVIVVSVNYRLGVFGYLAHPGLTAESPDHVSGNYGLQDQVAALAWVNANIARFGGDPANVTIFGQSAGSMSVSGLITMPQARRHFRRAILQSGSPFGIGLLPTLAEAERSNADIGSIPDLRALPAAELTALWNRFAAGAPSTRRAIPLVDGHVLVRQPMDAFLAGAVRNLPLLIGSTVREIPAGSRDDLLQSARRQLGDDAGDAMAWYERQGSDALAGDPSTQMMTDMMFRCGSIMTARLGNTAWLYHFMENFPGRSTSGHSADVFYVFDSPTAGGRTAQAFAGDQRRLSDTMIGYWTNFARTGDPNGAGLARWHRYERHGEAYLELRAGNVRTLNHLRGDACGRFLLRWSRPAAPAITN